MENHHSSWENHHENLSTRPGMICEMICGGDVHPTSYLSTLDVGGNQFLHVKSGTLSEFLAFLKSTKKEKIWDTIQHELIQEDDTIEETSPSNMNIHEPHPT